PLASSTYAITSWFEAAAGSSVVRSTLRVSPVCWAATRRSTATPETRPIPRAPINRTQIRLVTRFLRFRGRKGGSPQHTPDAAPDHVSPGSAPFFRLRPSLRIVPAARYGFTPPHSKTSAGLMRERANWRAALWLRRHRIRGKRKFIWSIVVARLAFPAAAVATALRAAIDPWSTRHFLLRLLASAVAAVVGGYVGGVVLWDLVVDR